MSELVSMKLSKKDAKAMTEPSTSMQRPAYPYGLSLSLDDEALKKLGVKVEDVEVGATMTLIAKVDVTAVSKNESEGQPARENVSLQITDLCLEDSGSKATKAAGALYGET
jgi:hypothetical protein